MSMPSFAPSNALRMWTDGRDIFVEIPAKTKANPPCICRFARTEGGLSKALSILCSIAPDYAGEPQLTPKFTSRQESMAEAILRRQGTIK